MAKKETFTRLPDGRYQLKGSDSKITGAIVGIVVGIGALGAAAAFAMNTDDGGMWIPTTCCGIIGTLALLGGIWTLISGLMVSSKIHSAAVIVERWPLRLGERFNVEYEQQAKGSMKIDRVTLTLTCQEWVRYRQGTDTRTDKKDVYEQEVVLLESGDVPARWRLTGTAELTIPAERMHTIDFSNNKIKWTLKLTTEITSWPDYAAEFKLEVAPRLAPEVTS